MTRPEVAPLNLPIRAAAASRRPLRSSVPVTSITMMKMAMLRFATKVLPSVSSRVTGPRPPTSAVTTAATRMTRMESSFSAKPAMTMTMPSSFSSSIIAFLYTYIFPASYRAPAACGSEGRRGKAVCRKDEKGEEPAQRRTKAASRAENAATVIHSGTRRRRRWAAMSHCSSTPEALRGTTVVEAGTAASLP